MPTQAEKRTRALAALEAIPTYAERLANVVAAIHEILVTGQSVSYQGRSLSMADLDSLRKLEKEYEAEAANELATCAGRSRVYNIAPMT